MIRFQVTNQTKIQQEIYKHLLLQKKIMKQNPFLKILNFKHFRKMEKMAFYKKSLKDWIFAQVILSKSELEMDQKTTLGYFWR